MSRKYTEPGTANPVGPRGDKARAESRSSAEALPIVAARGLILARLDLSGQKSAVWEAG